jgi:Cu/Ag efflux protein CusF
MAAPLLLAAAFVQAQSPNASGEVTKIDRAAARVTFRQGEIRALDMPPMTMSWRVRDARLLEGLAVGDRVRFTGEKVEGQYVVTAIVKAP